MKLQKYMKTATFPIMLGSFLLLFSIGIFIVLFFGRAATPESIQTNVTKEISSGVQPTGGATSQSVTILEPDTATQSVTIE